MTGEQSPAPDHDLPREVLQNDMVEIWINHGTGEALHDRKLPGERVENELRRILLCPPLPDPDLSEIIPNPSGFLLRVSRDFLTELIMRMCPSCESKNTALRRLLIHQDIYFSKKFRVATAAEKAWINADRVSGNDVDPRKRREGRK